MSQGGGGLGGSGGEATRPSEAGGEPSMEDILASIRRILNDDAEPPPAPIASADPEPKGDDVFELDQSMIVEEPAEPAMMALPEEPAATYEPPEPEPAPAPRDEEPLVGVTTAAAASASIGALVRVLGQRQTAVYRGGPTLEDLVREELRPMLKTWLDENLAPMVERAVRAEIERVTRNSL